MIPSLPRRVTLGLTILVVLSGGAGASPEPTAACPQYTLYFTAATAGHIEPCDCAIAPSGGLARRAGFIASNTPEGRVPVLIAGGDYLATSGRHARMRTEYLFRMLRGMGYSILGVGPRDFAYGVEYLRSVAQRYDFTFTCANIADSASGERVFPQSGVIGTDGGLIGVISVLGRDRPPLISPTEHALTVSNPAAAARAVADSLHAHVDLVVLLANVGKETVPSLLDISSVDVVIVTRYISGTAPYRSLGMERGTLLAFTSYQARRIGYAHLRMGPACEIVSAEGDLVPLDASIPEDDGISALIHEYQMQKRNPHER